MIAFLYLHASDVHQHTLNRNRVATLSHLYMHAEPWRHFPSFCGRPFFPNTTESKSGLYVSDELRRTP